MEKVKLIKNGIVKIVPVEYKSDFISAGYKEIIKDDKFKNIGINTNNKYGNNKY